MGDNLVIGGIVLGTIITALLELLKRFGLPDQYVPWVNLLLTAAATALVLFTQQKPETVPLVVVVLQVLIIFLTAAGVYTTIRWAKQTGLGTHSKN